VISLAEAVGFIFDGQDDDVTRRGKTVHCEYTADKKAMMKWIYWLSFGSRGSRSKPGTDAGESLTYICVNYFS
jgi:hypothetical protein